jgi:hypothetical protein
MKNEVKSMDLPSRRKMSQTWSRCCNGKLPTNREVNLAGKVSKSDGK